MPKIKKVILKEETKFDIKTDEECLLLAKCMRTAVILLNNDPFCRNVGWEDSLQITVAEVLFWAKRGGEENRNKENKIERRITLKGE